VIDRNFLAQKHTGMKVSIEGALSRVKRADVGTQFVCDELLRHMREMASRFYAGDIAVVDEFLQLYCMDEERPKQEELTL